MIRRRFLKLGLPAILGFGALACRSKEAKKTTVLGRVWYRGQPLPGGLIVFVPDEERGNGGDLRKGTIAANGGFTLGDEVTPGWYRVAIAPICTTTPSAPSAAAPYPGPPARYRNPRLSGLQGEVRAETENVFEFELDDA